MGANNWATCPRCMKRAAEEKEKLEKQAALSYGKVSEIQYVEILAKAQKDIELEQTLREDYEFQMDDDGDFFVDYRAHCTVCDFTHKFQHKEKATI